MTTLEILESLRSALPSEETVLTRREAYGAPRWRSAFVETDSGKPVHESPAAADVSMLLERFPASISRQEILELAASDASASGHRRLWIAAMMWGKGTRGLHWDPTLKKVAAFLAREDLDELLAGCEQDLRDGDVEAAYARLTGVAGIRSAFMTKYLYFLGRFLDSSGDYPLILDTFVAESLTWLAGLRAYMVVSDVRPRDDAASYARYVRAMHRWARELDTSADILEFFLWREGRPKRFILKTACAGHWEA